MPLVAEACVAAAAAFLVGVVLAYLVGLRRRSAADRRW